MPTPALMFQATSSDAGKTLLVAGLCRAYARRGLRVLPFKPQNMSNNAAVAAGGELGRAQALQARAAGVPPRADMNPILLKPEAGGRAQLVVQGRARGSFTARAYYGLREQLLPRVLESFARIAAEADLVLVEGAGSASEVNLRRFDLANMGFAVAAEVPAILVGDIERGGVIASLVGTTALLEPAERALLRGFLVNKFRGDPGLFREAVPLIEERTGLPCLGIVPWFDRAHRLPAEDVLGLEQRARQNPRASLRVAVPRLPRIANFDDLDPLAQEPEVALRILDLDAPLPADTDLLLLPGSKAVIDDLLALRRSGFDADILAHRRRGGMIIGLCGGYQMLGRRIVDPEGVEGPPREVPGLGLLDVETRLMAAKTVREVRGRSWLGAEVRGYEIHLGRTTGPDRARAVVTFADGREDGARSPDGGVIGSYVHGLFASDALRARLFAHLGTRAALAHERTIEETLDALADHLEAALDLGRLLSLARR